MSTKKEITKDQLDSFCSITGSTNERAQFFLEAANGNLDLAISSFFEGGAGNDDMGSEQQSGGGINTGQYQFDDNESDEEDFPSQPREPPIFSSSSASSKNKPVTSSKPASKIMTLGSLNNEDDDENSGERQGQAFYAGGSEQSGQQILGPPRQKAEHIIKNLFEKAKEHGATEVKGEDEASGSSRKPVVYGTGYRLGTGNEPQEVVQGPPRPKQPKVHVLKLWKNGFNIDDGQLRLYSDPQNKDFLQSIERGEPPRELLRQAEGAEVHVDMQDHREEEYVAPKGKYVLYNDGYKLGSPTPNVVSDASPNDQEANEKKAKEELSLDESKPTTQIQIRLSNGSRLIIKANQTHRISDLRLYINRARPEYSKRVYSLMTSFPNKEIANENETLQQANLLNAVIIQKLKE